MGTREFPALPQDKLLEMKQFVEGIVPTASLPVFKDIWQKCVAQINQACNRLRTKFPYNIIVSVNISTCIGVLEKLLLVCGPHLNKYLLIVKPFMYCSCIRYIVSNVVNILHAVAFKEAV